MLLWHYMQIKKSVLERTDFFVVLPGFEPGQTEPKPVVLPLHHRTILICSLLKSSAKIVQFVVKAKFFPLILCGVGDVACLWRLWPETVCCFNDARYFLLCQ